MRRARGRLEEKLAGELGFEPRQTESESVVLPLHHSPMDYPAYSIAYLAIRVNRLRRDQDKSPPRWWGRSTRLILPLASAEAEAFFRASACRGGGFRKQRPQHCPRSDRRHGGARAAHGPAVACLPRIA